MNNIFVLLFSIAAIFAIFCKKNNNVQNFNDNLTKGSYAESEVTFRGTATNTADASTISITNGKFYTEFSH